MTGHTVLAAKGNTIDLSGLASGIYVARAKSAGATATIKLARN